MIRLCDRADCGEPAAWSFKLCVPAQGKSPRDFAPLQALVGVTLCPRHMHETNPGEWLDAHEGNMRAVFTQMANGRARPDFARAWLQPVSINSPEFANFERMAARERH